MLCFYVDVLKDHKESIAAIFLTASNMQIAVHKSVDMVRKYVEEESKKGIDLEVGVAGLEIPFENYLEIPDNKRNVLLTNMNEVKSVLEGANIII